MNKVPESFIINIKKHLDSLDLSASKELIATFRNVPREYFVPNRLQRKAYNDTPLPIPAGQTISAPHMYAIMMSDDVADLERDHEVMEIGTGSGYGAALLADYLKPKTVITVERHQALVKFARDNLEQVGITNVEVIHADGTKGIPKDKKFDRIIVTATADSIPEPLLDQLKLDGVLVIPVKKMLGEWLLRVTLDENRNPQEEKIIRVRFVPLVDEEGN